MKNGKAIAKVCHYPLIFKNKRQGKKKKLYYERGINIRLFERKQRANLVDKIKTSKFIFGLII